MNAESGGPRRVVRQLTPQVLAVFVWAVCALVGLGALTDGADAPLLAWLVATALLAWVLFWRPAVVLDQQGVELRNLVRDTRVPWPMVDAVDRRWNLGIMASDDRTYTSWAISSSPSRSGKVVAPHITGLFPGGRSAAWEAADVDPRAHQPRSGLGTDAASLARDIDALRDEYDAAVADGDVAPVGGPVVRWPARGPLVALLTAAALVAVALLL